MRGKNFIQGDLFYNEPRKQEFKPSIILNEEQEKIVRFFGSPLLVVAGAGSGKTMTIAYKVKFLIEKKGIDPSKILIVTFSKKAAEEIKKRIKKVTGLKLKWVGTFHSIAFKFLKEKGELVGLNRDFTILEDRDKEIVLQKIIKDYLGEIKIEEKNYIELKDLQDFIAQTIEDMKDPRDAVINNKFDVNIDNFIILLDIYEKYLIENNCLDFTHILYFFYKLLQLDKTIKENFVFILVDEFQDTNTIQYEILKLLLKHKNNICVVGDPNQCIYAWRYARPDNIVKFRKDFNSNIINLTYNYRSTPLLINFSNAILTECFKKILGSDYKSEWYDLVLPLKPVRELTQEMKKPLVIGFANEREEAKWIASKIEELSKIYKLSEIAVLYRNNELSYYLEQELAFRKIPFNVIGEKGFFERDEVKDFLSFLKFIVNPKDISSFKRAIKVVLGKIADKTIEEIKELGKGNLIKGTKLILKQLYDDNLWKTLPDEERNLVRSIADKLDGVLKFLNLIEKSDDYDEWFRRFLSYINYEKYNVKDNNEDKENGQKIVNQFLDFLEKCRLKGYKINDIVDMVNWMKINKNDEGVKIMTIHASKGLEFDVVFLPRLEDHILPHSSALEFKNNKKEMEEELRIFYVGVTRAKNELYISYVKTESRFLQVIPIDLYDYKDLS